MTGVARPAQHILAAFRLNHQAWWMDAQKAFITPNIIEGLGPGLTRSGLKHFCEVYFRLAGAASSL